MADPGTRLIEERQLIYEHLFEGGGQDCSSCEIDDQSECLVPSNTQCDYSLTNTEKGMTHGTASALHVVQWYREQ